MFAVQNEPLPLHYGEFERVCFYKHSLPSATGFLFILKSFKLN